ncbi:MAG: hypothetical protein JNJ58_05990 [Chitinophagaceae bacterium]|nr:hypothetical protein [Chitinophagaceae bacterium]
MHFIQNIWLAQHWTWLLVIFAGSLAIVAYINNRMGMLKKSLATFIVLLTFSMFISIQESEQNTLNIASTNIEQELPTQSPTLETPSLFGKMIEFAGNILKDKLED